MTIFAIISQFFGDNKAISIAGGIVAIIAAFLIWLALHDRETIKNANAKINIEALELERAANMEADKKSADLAIITAQEAAQRQKDIDDAVKNFPVETRGPSGPATNAVADRLRARANRGD